LEGNLMILTGWPATGDGSNCITNSNE
jgi:hypothetical protein